MDLLDRALSLGGDSEEFTSTACFCSRQARDLTTFARCPLPVCPASHETAVLAVRTLLEVPGLARGRAPYWHAAFFGVVIVLLLIWTRVSAFHIPVLVLHKRSVIFRFSTASANVLIFTGYLDYLVNGMCMAITFEGRVRITLGSAQIIIVLVLAFLYRKHEQ